MAIVTPALIQSLFTAWKGDFKKGVENADTQWRKIATEIPSTTKSNTYGWLGKFPKFREWIGDRVINSMKAHGYTVTNKTFESTVGVSRDDIEDDEVGIYGAVFEEMGNEAEAHPDDLVFNLLASATTTLCYDGQNFLDTDHPVYPNADGTGSAVSVSNYDDNGGTGTTWYLLDVTRPIKPFIFQNRRKPDLKAMTKLDDEHVFTSNEYRFGADCRGNAGVGFWQMIYGSRKPLTGDNLWEAVTAMREFKADGGRKLKIKPSLLVVPPSLEKEATRLLERELDSNSSNELKGRLELLVADYL